MYLSLTTITVIGISTPLGKLLPCAATSVLSACLSVLAYVCPILYWNRGGKLPILEKTSDYFLNLGSSCPRPLQPQVPVSVAPCPKHSLRKKMATETAALAFDVEEEDSLGCVQAGSALSQGLPNYLK